MIHSHQTNGRAHWCFRSWKINNEGYHTGSVVTLMAQNATAGCSIWWEKLGGIRLIFDVSPCISLTNFSFRKAEVEHTETEPNSHDFLIYHSVQSASSSCLSLRPCSQCVPWLCLVHPSTSHCLLPLTCRIVTSQNQLKHHGLCTSLHFG